MLKLKKLNSLIFIILCISQRIRKCFLIPLIIFFASKFSIISPNFYQNRFGAINHLNCKFRDTGKK